MSWLKKLFSRSNEPSPAPVPGPVDNTLVDEILAERRPVSELPELDLARYRSLIAHIPRPTDHQVNNFAFHVAGAKSWYKHLPLVPPGGVFHFYIDPWAGLDRLLLPGHEAVHLVRHDEAGKFHYTWMKTEQYRSRFSRLAFSCESGSDLYLGRSCILEGGRGVQGCLDINTSRPSFYVSDREECRLPPEVLQAGAVQLTGVIHPHTSSLSGLDMLRTDRIDTGVVGFAYLERVEQLAREVEPKRSKLSSPGFEEEREKVEAELGRILAPERERQHKSMVEAMHRVVDLVYADNT